MQSRVWMMWNCRYCATSFRKKITHTDTQRQHFTAPAPGFNTKHQKVFYEATLGEQRATVTLTRCDGRFLHLCATRRSCWGGRPPPGSAEVHSGTCWETRFWEGRRWRADLERGKLHNITNFIRQEVVGKHSHRKTNKNGKNSKKKIGLLTSC